MFLTAYSFCSLQRTPHSVLPSKWLQLGAQSQNFNSNIVWRKLNLPEWLIKADLNCRMQGEFACLVITYNRARTS